MRSTRLRQRSKRTQKTYRDERVPLVERLLRERPRCEIRYRCDGARAVDVHEVLTRGRGGSITDARNCLTACRACHTWVTDNPRPAQCLGFVLPSWSENAVDDPWAVAAVIRRSHAPCPWGDGTACGSTCDRQRAACRPVDST